MAKIKKREQKNTITWRMDMKQINSFYKFAFSIHSKISDLINLKSLLDCLDMDAYKYNQDIYMRLEALKYIIEAKVDYKLTDNDVIYSYVLDHDNDLKEIMDNISYADDQIAGPEVRNISEVISEKVNASMIYSSKDEVLNLYDDLENSSFYSIKDTLSKMRTLFQRILTNMQNISIRNGLVRTLNFTDPSSLNTLSYIIEKNKKPGSVLFTGIRQLNAILSPGFCAERLYVFLGLSGRFKSGTLLNIADQIRKFNPNIISENGRRKVILFITMENSIEETIVRLYDMYSEVNDEFVGKSLDYVKEILKERGQFTFNDPNYNGISIEFMYFSNMEINTASLYNIVQKLNDEGKDVIALILDYIKRIDSVTNHNGDERLRLGYVSQELKSFAQYYEIPVITAMQINREGNSIVDAAMRENKSDVLKFVGSSNIGNSWTIVEESDWISIINLEIQRSTEKMFLTIKRVKMRGKTDPSVSDYFNHPFANEKNIRLATDVDQSFSISIRSLATDLEGSSPTNDKFERPDIPELHGEDKSKDLLTRLELM